MVARTEIIYFEKQQIIFFFNILALIMRMSRTILQINCNVVNKKAEIFPKKEIWPKVCVLKEQIRSDVII